MYLIRMYNGYMSMRTNNKYDRIARLSIYPNEVMKHWDLSSTLIDFTTEGLQEK